MPELPDITIYLEALEQRILGHKLEKVLISSPFLLRTAVPPVSSLGGKKLIDLRRLGKRLCLGFEDNIWLVIHLMIAGRLHWKSGPSAGTRSPSKFKAQLAIFQFDTGILSLTEAGTQRRASVHVVAGEAGLKSLDRGGTELFTGQKRKGSPGKFIDLQSFTSILKSENHTLKRALNDPRLFSGIGNAYSDEILWQAELSPVKLTGKLSDEEIGRLYVATRDTLQEWTE